MKSYEEIHLIFSEIISGFSILKHSEFGEVYIKHSSHLDSVKAEKQYLIAFEEARKNNLPSYKEREEAILKEELWSKKQESELTSTKDFIQTLKSNISVDYLYTRRQNLKKEIKEAGDRLNVLYLKKDYLIGQTAEKYAHKKSDYFKIINSFYKDELLTEKLIVNELNGDEYEEFLSLYSKYFESIRYDIIKKISLSPFFTNLFHMCGDNAYYFYGKPIIQLTNHQSDLFLFGRYFKNLISQYGDKLPKDFTEPDDIIEWFEINQNVEKSGILKEDESGEGGGASSVVGANKKDLEMMGVDTSMMVNMSKKIKEAGGTLNKEQLFKMQNN